MSLERPEYVSDLMVYLLNELGVEYAPLNPGATTRGLHESMVNYGGNKMPELITCCHEELAVAMAEGFYLATGKLQVSLAHNIVGLQHASKAIYEAFLNNIPMIIMGGTGMLLRMASFAFLTGLGFCQYAFRVANSTLIQTSIPDQLRGRVMSIYMLDNGIMPVATLLLGLLIHLWSPAAAFAIFGVLALAATVLMALGFHQVRRLE